MRLTVLGCSGSMPSPASPASGYLLQARDDAGRERGLVLDLGSGAFGPLQRHADPGALDAVLLSHLHPDHCADVTALAVWLQYGPGSPGPRLPVLGPPGTLERLAGLTMSTPQQTEAVFDVRTLQDGVAVEIGPFTVTPHAVEHPVPAFGFHVAGPGKDGGVRTLGYTGDTDACEGAVRLGRDVDVLLAEAAFGEHESVRGIHLTGARAGEIATSAGARSLVLTHLQPWADPEEILQAARSRYDGPLALAEPGGVLTL